MGVCVGGCAECILYLLSSVESSYKGNNGTFDGSNYEAQRHKRMVDSQADEALADYVQEPNAVEAS